MSMAQLKDAELKMGSFGSEGVKKQNNVLNRRDCK
jgi:hypothetical protein